MRFFRGRSSRVTADMSFGLTEAGKKKAEEFSAQGPKFEILATLREQGVCTIGELSEETHIPTERLKQIVKTLRAQGYIRFTGGEE